MRVYVTKHVLTQGIREIEVEIDPRLPNLATHRDRELLGGAEFFHGEGKDWHRTLDGARARAEKVRAAKIASLKKGITRLEALEF